MIFKPLWFIKIFNYKDIALLLYVKHPVRFAKYIVAVCSSLAYLEQYIAKQCRAPTGVLHVNEKRYIVSPY